jgi:signal peptidase I
VVVNSTGVEINGHLLSEPYAQGVPHYSISRLGDIGDEQEGYPYSGSLAPIVVPTGNVFVLGDNRNDASDSHVVGFIDQDKVIGRYWLHLWPQFYFYV